MAATPQPRDDETLAGPPGSCCMKGSLHVGEPKGTFEILAGFKTYISKPDIKRANGNILFYFPDAYGFFINNFLNMDAFAEAGYLVLGIDYFHGDDCTKHMDKEGFDSMAWAYKHAAVAEPGVPLWIAAAKDKFATPNAKFACVGYCFGGPYVCNELSDDGSCSVGAVAHPGMMKESHFKRLTKPLFLSSPVEDPVFPTEQRRRAADILQQEGKQYHIQEFQGVEHGYAVRCDLDKPYERWAKEHCHRSMIEWFDCWLSLA